MSGLYRCFGRGIAEYSIEKRAATPGPERYELTIAVVTNKDDHLLSFLPEQKGLYKHVVAEIDDPMFLGFACQRYLGELAGRYDWYGFMEDDLIVHDPFLLAKLNHFSRTFGNDKVLQPNRFECRVTGTIKTFYVDGPIRKGAVDKIRPIQLGERLSCSYLGREIEFIEARNPHSGCYFLNAQQMAYWASQEYFAKPSSAFIGPLESAATLGLLQTFRVFKTAPRYLDYLEIEHYGNKFISGVG